MIITITAGKGHAKTLLSAFDAALKDAGVHNYNLIRLSSIVPPNTKVLVHKYQTPPKEYGHRLYVVQAEIRSRESGKYIGAALGWYQLADGRGLFVEHEETGETKKAVESNLAENVRKSLMDLCRHRGVHFDEKIMHMKSSIVKVKDSPACALVLAVYQAEGWE